MEGAPEVCSTLQDIHSNGEGITDTPEFQRLLPTYKVGMCMPHNIKEIEEFTCCNGNMSCAGAVNGIQEILKPPFSETDANDARIYLQTREDGF